MAADDDTEIPWFAPGHSASQPGQVYTPRLRERVWTLTKRSKRIEAELLFHGESYGWECRCLHDGVLAYGQRFALREGALKKADAQHKRLIGEGWATPAEIVDSDSRRGQS